MYPIFIGFAEVGKENTNTSVQEAQLAEAVGNGFVLILGGCKNGGIRGEFDGGAGFGTDTGFFNRVQGSTAGIFLHKNLALAVYRGTQVSA